MLTIFAVIGMVAVVWLLLYALGRGAQRQDVVDAVTASKTANEVRAGQTPEWEVVDRVVGQIEATTAETKQEALALFKAGKATHDEARARILKAVLKACLKAPWPGGASFSEFFPDSEERLRIVVMMTDAAFDDMVPDDELQRRERRGET